MANAPEAEPPKDSIVFRGDTEKTIYIRDNDIADHHFREVKLDGDRSIYYVYPEINQGGHSTPKDVQVVTKTSYDNLTIRPPKSCKGFSKEGIILFETFNYGGESQNFIGSGVITETFPVERGNGVSSFHVMDGTWELFGVDGGKIIVHGETEFGPGTRTDMPYPSDKVVSIKRIR